MLNNRSGGGIKIPLRALGINTSFTTPGSVLWLFEPLVTKICPTFSQRLERNYDTYFFYRKKESRFFSVFIILLLLLIILSVHRRVLKMSTPKLI